MREAPLFIRAYDLHNWLLDRFDSFSNYPAICGAVLQHSVELLDAVSLALSRFDTWERLIEADEHATLLRVHLRLAAEKKLLTDRQLVYVTGELRDVGRQIGGWRRRLEAVE